MSIGEKIYLIPGRKPLNISSVQRPIGRVEINPELCKGCNFCIEFCPNNVLELSGKINKQGYQYPRVNPDKENECVSCGMCEKVCPEFAINVYDYRYVAVGDINE
jgi:NAD-dependent dihydropyrimidine dehydrogenase PreA subunit